MDENEKGDATLKILILGDTAVGKTSLSLKYVDGFFPENYISTIGVEYKIKLVELNGTKIILKIWDTCGQERYKSLARTFLKDADGILFVYDISNKQSFEHIKDWIRESEESNSEFQKIVLGNKIDLPEKSREVPKEKLIKYINEKKYKGLEVSAKTGENVENAFSMLTQLLVGNMSKEEIIKKYEKNNAKNKLKSGKNNKKKKLC